MADRFVILHDGLDDGYVVLERYSTADSPVACYRRRGASFDWVGDAVAFVRMFTAEETTS